MGQNKAGYYLHIQPGGSFLAGGIYMPESSLLKEIREEISYNEIAFRKTVENEQFILNFGGLNEEGKLKRIPKGFEKEDPMAEYLKLKHFVAIRPVVDKEFQQKNIHEEFGQIYKAAKPLNDFLNG